MSGPRGLPASGAARAITALVVVAVVATGTFLLWPRSPDAVPARSPAASAVARTGEATPPRVAIAVSLSRRDAGPALVGLPVSLSAHALAEATITALELWDGSAPVATQLATSRSPALSARWTWTPDAPGRHLLVARATDASGSVRQSNAVWIDVDAAPGTASEPRARLAQAPMAPPPPPFSLPALEATLDGCAAQLALTGLDDASGFSVYALAPGGFSFSPLGTLPAPDPAGSYTVPMSRGMNAIVIGAFDSAVEILTPPVVIDAPDECDAGEWSGGIAIGADGRLIGGPPVDRGYLYLRRGTEAAVRIPATSFVESTSGQLDFSGQLPPFGGDAPIHVEAWGWRSGTLVPIGRGTWTPQPPQGAAPGGAGSNVAFGGTPALAGIVTTLDAVRQQTISGGAGTPCSGEFCVVDALVRQDDVVWPTVDGEPSPERTLRWSTQTIGVTSVVWQILPYAPPPVADLSPPFVVDQGVITLPPGTTDGELFIDFATYLGPQPITAELGGAGDWDSSLDGAFAIPGMPPSTPLPPPSPTPHAGGGIGNVGVGSIGQIIPASIANQAYVRIIPMQGPIPSVPSNHVRFDIVPPPPQVEVTPAPPYYTENLDAHTVTWTFSPPIAANPAYARCAEVIGFTDDYEPPPPLWPATYEIGKVICYDPPDDDGGVLGFVEDAFESFVDLVKDVWEGITEGYDWIKAQVVKAILVAVPCKQIADDDVCQVLAETALSVALAAVGVPPTLPDYDAVMQGLKGDLRTMVLEAASSAVPGVAETCGVAQAGQSAGVNLPTCEALVDEAIDEIIEQVQAEVSAVAGASTGLSWPGVIFAPDPRGVYMPPTVELTITRTDEQAVPDVCTVNVEMESVKADHTWKELVGTVVLATGTVKGQPFLAEKFAIPKMQPGEVTTRTVWLSKPAMWFETPDAKQYWAYYEGHPEVNRAWVLLTAGAELTFKVSGNCLPASSQGPHVLTESAVDS